VLRSPLGGEENGPITDAVLAFSPDSRQLVFSRSSWGGWTAGPPALLAIPVGGGEPVPLAQSGIPGASLVPSDAQQLQWSPDGRWLAYVEGESLDIARTTGQHAPLTLTCGSGADYWEFSWSPTSKLLAYDCADYYQAKWTYRFMTIKPDGTNHTDLLQSHSLAWAAQIQWSPNGSRLLFEARRISHRPLGVWTILPNGQDLTRIG